MEIPSDFVTVRDLMLEDAGHWNVRLILRLFARDSAEAILKVRISEFGPLDSLFWPLKGSGLFSVKSAHSAIVKQRCPTLSPLRPS